MAEQQTQAEEAKHAPMGLHVDHRLRLKARIVSAVLTALALLLPLCVIMMITGVFVATYRDVLQEVGIVEALTDAGGNTSRDHMQWMRLFDENAQTTSDLMAEALKELDTPEGYVGPRVFTDGIVIELRDGEPYYPSDYPEDALRLTREEFESVRSGSTFLHKEWFAQLVQADSKSTPNEEDANAAYVTVGEIGDNVFYVGYTPYYEYARYLAQHDLDDEYCHIVELARQRGVLIVQKDDPTLKLQTPSAFFPEMTHATDIGLTKAMVDQQDAILTSNGSIYICTYSEIKGTDLLAIFVHPSLSPFIHGAMRSLFVVLVIALIVVMLVVYVASVRSYVQKWPINELQEGQYQPRTMATRLLAAGIAGALLVYSTASFVHLIGTLHTESVADGVVLDAIMNETIVSNERGSKLAVEEQESFYVYAAERMARLIQQYPELGSSEKLAAYADILGVNYVMLFDGEGNETACSGSYVGFSLGQGQGENAEDFRRLLNGVSSVCHEASYDEMTGERLRFVGVTLPVSGSVTNGALVMAVPPERIERAKSTYGIDEQLSLLAAEGETFLVATAPQEGEDPLAAGVITYASRDDLKGKRVTDCGLLEESLRDGYMDFSVVNEEGCFVMTKGDGTFIYYLAISNAELFGGRVLYACIATVLFLVVYRVTRGIMMGNYQADFDRRVVVDQAIIDELKLHAVESPEEKKPQKGSHHPIRRRLEQMWRRFVSRWKAMVPEDRTRAVLVTALFATVLLVYLHESNSTMTYTNGDEGLLPFILHGNWMRGVNLFALCGILLVCAGSFAVIVLIGRLVDLSCTFLNSRDKTIATLAGSFLQYLVVGLAAYVSFGYLGFPTNTILGSLGLGGLALTLGSRDLVSDIIAGVSIVFEGGFKIGDVIEVGGFKGTVEEIGVRSTTLLGEGGNVKVFNNRDVKNVLNLSRYNSTCSVDVKVASEELEHVESVLATELPLIGERYPDLMLGALRCGGIKGMAGGAVTLGISVECLEKNAAKVGPILNREVYALFQRAGIKLL